VALHLLHRYAALAAVLLLGVASVRALRAEPARLGPKLVLVLLAGEVALGLFTVASGFSLPLAILHSTCAAMLLAAVATQLRR
jgi:cytochrome c oxidase assembly protein subunit 15